METITTLDTIKMTAREMFADVFVNAPNVNVIRHSLVDMHEVFVSGKVYGESNLQEYRFQYPADWWQAVKEHFAPAWFLRRWPVLYTRHHISIDVVYPELSKRIKLPKESHKMILSGYSETDTKD